MFRLREATAYGLLALTRLDSSFPSWVVFGLHAALTFWQIHPNKRRRAIKAKSRKRDGKLSESSEEDATPLPPWFYLPGEEQIIWANRRLIKLWPHFGALLKNFIEETVESKLQEEFKDIYIHKITVGNNGPVIEAAELNFQESILRADIILSIIYTGNLDITLRTKQMSDNLCRISDFQLQGTLKVVFESHDPNEDHMQLDGATMCFLSCPRINFEINNFGNNNVENIDGLKETLKVIICDAVQSNMVEPHTMKIPLFESYDPAELVYHIPQGVLRVNLCDPKEQYFTEKESMNIYAEVHICDKKFSTKNMGNKELKQSFEGLVDNCSSQGVKIDIFEETLGDDILDNKIGHFHLCVNDLIKHVGEKICIPFNTDSERSKEIFFEFTWLDVVHSVEIPASISENMSNILIVKLISGDITVPVKSTPEKPQLKVVIKATLESETQETFPLLAEHLVWDEDLRFLVGNSVEKILNLEIVEKSTGKVLGSGSFDVKLLVSKENQGADIHMPLYTSKGEHSILICRFILLPLAPLDVSQQTNAAMDTSVILESSNNDLGPIRKQDELSMQQPITVVAENLNDFVVLDFSTETSQPITEQCDVEALQQPMTEVAETWNDFVVLECSSEPIKMQSFVEIVQEPIRMQTDVKAVQEPIQIKQLCSEAKQESPTKPINIVPQVEEDNNEPITARVSTSLNQQPMTCTDDVFVSHGTQPITDEICITDGNEPMKKTTETMPKITAQEKIPGNEPEIDNGCLQEPTVTGDNNIRQGIYANSDFIKKEVANCINLETNQSIENANAQGSNDDSALKKSSKHSDKILSPRTKQNYIIVERTVKEETIRILLEEHTPENQGNSLAENNEKVDSQLSKDIETNSSSEKLDHPQEMKETVEGETKDFFPDMNATLPENTQHDPVCIAGTDIVSAKTDKSYEKKQRKARTGTVFGLFGRTKDSSDENQENILAEPGTVHEPSEAEAFKPKTREDDYGDTSKKDYFYFGDSCIEDATEEFSCLYMRYTEVSPEEKQNYEFKHGKLMKDFNDQDEIEVKNEIVNLGSSTATKSLDGNYRNEVSQAKKQDYEFKRRNDDLGKKLDSEAVNLGNGPSDYLQDNCSNTISVTAVEDIKQEGISKQKTNAPVKAADMPQGNNNIGSRLNEEKEEPLVINKETTNKIKTTKVETNYSSGLEETKERSRTNTANSVIPTLKVTKSQEDIKISSRKRKENEGSTPTLKFSISQQNLKLKASTPESSAQKEKKRMALSTPNLFSTQAVSDGKSSHLLTAEDKAEKTSQHSYTGSLYDLHSWEDSSEKINSRGEIMLTLKYNHVNNLFTVIIHSARELVSRDSPEQTNMRVRIYLLPDHSAKSRRETKTLKWSQNPTFDTTFEYPVGLQMLKDRQLDVAVKSDKSRMFGKRSRQLLGQAVINLSKIDLSTGVTNWFALKK